MGSLIGLQGVFAGANPDTFTPNNTVSSVSFNREGFATTSAGFATTTLTLQDPTQNGAWTRCLIINPVGMVQTMTHTLNPGSC